MVDISILRGTLLFLTVLAFFSTTMFTILPQVFENRPNEFSSQRIYHQQTGRIPAMINSGHSWKTRDWRRNNWTNEDRESMWIGLQKLQSGKPRKKRFPDVIGIGVEKCGTGALAHFMKMHPLIKTPPGGLEQHFFNAHYKQGYRYYLNKMPEVTEDEVVMEKSPAYFNFPPVNIPTRMKMLLPNVKLIVVLCDPVNRTYSDFAHEKIMRVIGNRTSLQKMLKRYLVETNFERWKDLSPRMAYLHLISMVGRNYPFHVFSAGLYYYYLLYWVSVFKRDKIYVMDGEKLLSDPGSEIENIQSFLGIPPLLWAEDFVRNDDTGFFCFQPSFSTETRNLLRLHPNQGCLKSSKGRTRNKAFNISHQTISELRDFYRESNEKLYEFLGDNLGWQ